MPRQVLADPDDLTIRVFIDGELKQQTTTRNWCVCIRRLLADVTDFMTLSPGDILAVGAAAPAPRVRAGQQARIEIDGLGWLESPFVQGTA